MAKRKRNCSPGGNPRPACDYSKRERGDGHGRSMVKSKSVKPKPEGFGIDVIRNYVGLRRYFIFPPFSVLRTMDGEWMKRKRMWLSLGIKSEVGRGGVNENVHSKTKVSCGSSKHGGEVSKMAMHNDPMQRKRKYDEQA